MEKSKHAGRFASIMVFIDVAVFAAFGILFLAIPDTLLEAVDVSVDSPTGLIEVRAMYGGLELGIAAYLASYYFGRVSRRHVFGLSALCLGGLAAIRLVGMLVSGFHPVLVQLLASEVLGVVTNLIALHVTTEDGVSDVAG